MSINAGTAMGYLDLDTTKFKKGIRTALSELQGFNKNSSSTATKITAVSSAMSTFGKTLTTAVSVPLVGVGIASSKVAVDFESAMSEVQAISGATGKEFDSLNAKAIEMGAKTKFSATESAAAFKYMAMAGWDAQAMMDGISGIMSLAAASGEDLALTSDIVTDALTAFGMQASDSAHFADILAKASSRANTNVALMGETFKYVAPVAGALGYSAEDTAIAIGLMANSGIKGSQAGTALRSSLSRLVKPTDTVAEYMEKYKLSLTNTDGSMKTLGEVMGDFRNKLGNLSEAEQAQAASAIFGQEAMSGMLAIINASDKDYEKLTEEIYNASGASEEMASVMMNNTAGAVTLLKSALESAGIVVGQQLTPYIRQLAEWVTGLVERFNSLSEEQQEQITKWGLIIASIGPVLLIISKLINFFVSLNNIFTLVKTGLDLLASAGGFTALLNPIGLVVGAITGLVAVVVSLWNTNEEFRNKVIEIWNNLQISIRDFVSGIKEILNDLGLNFGEVKEAILLTWRGLCNALSPLITGAMEIVTKVIDGALDTVLGIFKVFAKLFKGDWKGALSAVEDIIDGWIETVLGVFSSMFETIGGFFKKILSGIQNVIDKGNEAKGITRGGMYADGSHADGLSYVPYDGYIAELHRGERVLTAEENRNYNKKSEDNNRGGDTFNFYNTKPTPYEYARQMKKAKEELLYGI